MTFNTLNRYASDDVRTITRTADGRQKLYDMKGSSSQKFEVNGKTVVLRTGGAGMKVVNISRKK